jgi:hypothetical protein
MLPVSPIVLAFDLRVRQSGPSAAPRTIDVNIWDQADDDTYLEIRSQIALETNRAIESTRNPLDLAYLTCIPRSWLSGKSWSKSITLVAFASTEIGPLRAAYRLDLADDKVYGCGIAYRDLLNAGWRSLGFDVTDDTLSTSLLYTVGGPGKMAALLDSNALNENGLFGDRGVATDFAISNAEICPEHAPFSAVELLIPRQ